MKKVPFDPDSHYRVVYLLLNNDTIIHFLDFW